MNLKHIAHKAKHGAKHASKVTVDGAKAGVSQAKGSLACLEAINNVRQDVQGHDPRTWMKACAQSTLMQGKGAEYFKSCLLNKVKKEVKDVKDPEAYVDSLWNEIKGPCKL